MGFWVAPEHRDEVRPQQRLALELQTAHEEPELIWPEPTPLSSLGMPVLVVVGDQDKPDFITIARHLAGRSTEPSSRSSRVPAIWSGSTGPPS